MPKVTINGQELDYTPGQTILQVANKVGVAVPQYCYHDGLSIVASCRICLAECWAPNPRNNNTLEYLGKLLPTCQTACTDGMVVYTDSPKSIANQKSVMEYLLINHPLDCAVCDQAGECLLQDYSYEYGRGVSRFEENKVKQPKKDLGPHVYLYADRCIMCTRCVRFTREVTGTAELMVEGRGNTGQIDVFPGIALDNELSANVIDLCPVGALLDKDFLFTQRVWFLKETPSIDGTTAGGDNISIHHNEGMIYRLKPRTNMEVNKWWISDEVRYGYKFVHDEKRLRSPVSVRFGKRAECDFERAYNEIGKALKGSGGAGFQPASSRLLLMVSPMLSCEDAFLLARAAMAFDKNPIFAVGPVPIQGQDKTFPGGYTVHAEKAPNARGVRRVLEALAKEHNVSDAKVRTFEELEAMLKTADAKHIGAMILTGNYPSEWVTEGFANALRPGTPTAREGVAPVVHPFLILIDTLPNRLTELADVVLPGASWAEKAGTFENAKNMLQAFEQAIPVIDGAKSEGQIALDLIAEAGSGSQQGAPRYNAAETRRMMADPSRGGAAALSVFLTDVRTPAAELKQEADMEVVEL